MLLALKVARSPLIQCHTNFTPLHPEEALRAAGTKFEASTAKKDLFATHTVIDNEGRFVTGQNQNSGHVTAHEMMRLAKSAQ